MTPFTYDFPYSSQRMPVFAANAVATSQPLAAQAGLEMLRRGGTAADAAVATAAALSVVEPTSNGIGADNFALVWAGGGLHGLNGSGRSGSLMTPERFSGERTIPFAGWSGITVPGAVSGWVETWKKFGRLPLAEVLAPAIHYARDGFLVSPQTGYYWNRGARSYRGERFAEWQKTFAPKGDAPGVGEHFASENHARTLEAIAQSGGEDFYRGEIAKAIAAASAADGGFLTAQDLAEHRAEWVRPISVDYRGYLLHEIPPNGQGLAALIMLGILREFDLKAHPVDSVESLHLQIEAMKLAFADGHRYIADPAFMDVAVEELLEPSYLKSRAALIRTDAAQDFAHGSPKEGGTVYLTAADAEGMMVSFIQSNYTGFGSGVVVPGTGIAMQNRGCCFTLEEGHPNQVGPRKRPYHTIIPAFVTKRDANGHEMPVMSFGVMGGFMQPQGHAQVLLRIVDYGQNPQAALDAPRWQVTEGRSVSIEPGFPEEVYAGLESLGHDVDRARARTVSHGRGQILWKLEGGYLAASDLRSDGQAVGF